MPGGLHVGLCAAFYLFSVPHATLILSHFKDMKEYPKYKVLGYHTALFPWWYT